MLRNRKAVENSRVPLSPIINDSRLPRIYSSVTFQPLVHRIPPHEGKTNLASEMDALGVFKLFWSDEQLRYIADSTNQYADEFYEKRKKVKRGRHLTCGSNSTACRCRPWKKTNPEEIVIFLGVLMLLGVLKARKVENCWTGSEWGKYLIR
jgi:hypothetical protein